MTKKDGIILLLLGALVAVVTHDCSKNNTPQITIKTDTIRDTTHIYTEVIKPKPFQVTFYDTLIQKEMYVDSNYCKAFISDYLALKQYDTIIRNDSDLTVKISADVQQNELQRLYTDITINRPTLITTVINNNEKRFGVGFTASHMNLNIYGTYRYKDIEFVGGYDLNYRLAVFGANYKIW